MVPARYKFTYPDYASQLLAQIAIHFLCVLSWLEPNRSYEFASHDPHEPHRHGSAANHGFMNETGNFAHNDFNQEIDIFWYLIVALFDLTIPRGAAGLSLGSRS